MEYTQEDYDEAITDQQRIDDLNSQIHSLITNVHLQLGGANFELPDDLECQIYDLTATTFDARLYKMRQILEGGNPLYQSVTYVNEHGGYYDC